MPLFRRGFCRRRPTYSDGVIDLYPMMTSDDPELSIRINYVFRICPSGSRKEAGQISLRMGEGEGIYYFGHIGYHVDPPYRGHGYAQRACLLLAPLCRALDCRSLVITTDVDNAPSRRICENLNCVLESITPVPIRMQNRFQLSAAKCRYIWRIPFEQEEK